MTSEVLSQQAKSDHAPFTVVRSSQITERRTAIATYLLALLLGLGLAAYMFPPHMIFATDSLIHPLPGSDASIHAVGQEYFVKDKWRWPLLVAKPLGAPEGTNIAFTDSIPLIALLMKLFRHLLPVGFHSITLWLAICWTAQPIAAVFAFRSAGERRLLPNLAVALMAASMPTLLFRTGHAALCSHFLILIALGFYFRITRNARLGTVIGAGALILVALLINPYIMYMVIIVLAAAPLTLMIRQDRAWILTAGCLIGAVAITGIIALLLGYGRSLPMPGFGFYSMNLLSPIYPSISMIVPSVDGPIDATSGQYEGYQYLGVGVILLLLIADFCLTPRERLTLLRRHGGLAFVCVALILLALSNKVYAGHRLLLDLPAPVWLIQLRTTGRFFWPVAYASILIGALIVCRSLSRRWLAAVLLLLATLQYVESSPMRRWIRRGFKNHWEWAVNPAQLRPLLASHSKLIVWPKYGCGGDPNSLAFSHVFLLAAEVAIPVNTSYVGRFTAMPQCELPKFPISVDTGELWIFAPKATPAMVMSVVDWRDICRQLDAVVVCAQDLRGRADLPLPTIPVLPTGKILSTGANGQGDQALVSGWSDVEPWGVWSEAPDAQLIVNLARPSDKGLILTAWARGIGVPPSMTQQVIVSANGLPVATWNVKEGADSEYAALIPASSRPGQPVVIEFHMPNAFTPPWLAKMKVWDRNDRKLGIGLAAFRIDEQK